MKTINIQKNVYELTKEYPELIDILADIGFTELQKKAMRLSMGKIMTLEKGSQLKNIPMPLILETLKAHGFEVEMDRKQLLKSYLERLNKGEDLEDVRKDFVENFSDVDASEIMEAEQDMLKNGTPLHEVQQLCDVHSALFHGQLVQSPEEKMALLASIPGHPLHTMIMENNVIASQLRSLSSEQLEDIIVHYNKKGDLLYPHLNVKYGISGPSDVMWTVDNEIRSDIHKGNIPYDRIEEMIYKENNILFPLCANHFSEEEWIQIYHDAKDYPDVLGVHNEWPQAEIAQKKDIEVHDDEIHMPGGHMTVHQLTAMLNTIPGEITFVDDQNINRFFNEGPKVFKRPTMAIDREVFSCHPPRVEVMVRKIIDDFRNNRMDQVPVWMEKEGKTFLVTYMAVRDHENNYVGTLEYVQDMTHAKEHFTEV